MTSFKNGIVYCTIFIVAILFSNCNNKTKQAPILLFNGTGTSANDVKAIGDILYANHIDFALINSAQLNELDTIQLRQYKLIIMAGGNFIEIGKNLTRETSNNIRKAVHRGLNYLGICAGVFLAGNTHNNSFSIAGDKGFRFYSAEDRGIRKAAVPVTNADGTIIEHYWEDGPNSAAGVMWFQNIRMVHLQLCRGVMARDG